MRIDSFFMRSIRPKLFLLGIACFLCSCTSHLEDAKFYYVQAQESSRAFKMEAAIGSFKKTLQEAEKAVAKNPSSQAYMLKGLAELHLNLWEDAEKSFLAAFSFGFDKGQENLPTIEHMGI